MFFAISLSTMEAQTNVNSSYKHDYNKSLVLNNYFRSFSIVTIEDSQVYNKAKDYDKQISISLPIQANKSMDLIIWPAALLTNQMEVRLASGKAYSSDNLPLPYRGYVASNNENKVRLTVNEGYVSGYVFEDGQRRYIEPLSNFIASASASVYITYLESDVLKDFGNYCMAMHTHEESDHVHDHVHCDVASASAAGVCYELDLAIASDYSMFTKYTNSQGVINHNVTVMNNVQGNYDDEFADEIKFIIVEQFISDCPTCDPWTSSLDAPTVLNSFTNWGPMGFTATHDLGQFWTDRDFNGGTVGIAWLNAVCGSNRYHALSDFTSNASFLRVMTSHEIGHNFSATHDAPGAPYIMAPAVSSATAWSANSISQIESFYAGISCLSVCPPPLPPTAEFSAQETNICPGTTIQFYDESTDNPTSWSWSFTGGIPATSTEQFPFVTYNAPGTYSVSLTVSNNNGSNTETKNGYITVGASGTDVIFFDDFSSGLSNWTISNPDNGKTWEVATASGSTASDACVFMNNFDYNMDGQLDGLSTPVLNFSGRTNVRLNLEYAYARYNSMLSEIFRVYVSTDGGTNFSLVFTGQENGSGNWASHADLNSEFTPIQSSDWCVATTYGPACLNLDLSAYDGMSNVVIKLENENDWGNNFFLDNVAVFSSCEVVNPPVAEFTSDRVDGCVPLIVNFQDLSSENPSAWSWSFPGGNPETSTDQNPFVVYDQKGTYDVTLTVTNSAGSNTITKTAYINAQDSPVANFSYVITGSNVQFTNESSDDAINFLWDFGDGSSSVEENPLHTYLQDGTYTVVLSATNACGTTYHSETFTIETNVVADFTTIISEGCAPLTVGFTDASSSNVTNWEWTFEGGTPGTSNVQNPIIIYNEAGTFDVTLIVSNAQSTDTIVKKDYINIQDVPVIDFNALIDSLEVDFQNNTTGATSYLWDFGDGGSSTDQNPTHTYAGDGMYTVVLTATNSCGTSVDSTVIHLSNIPFAAFKADTTQGCVPFSVQFTDLSSANTTGWAWTFQGGTPETSNDQNPLVLYETPGTYDVTLIASNTAGLDTVVFENYIVVSDKPTAGYTFVTDSLKASFTNTSVYAESYLWNFGDGTTSEEINPVHNYSMDGTYPVQLIVTNFCGADTIVYDVVIATPVSAGAIANVTSGCVPLTVQFTSQSSANVINYVWSFPGGTPASSMEQNPVVVYNQAGTFDVSLTVSNSAFSDVVVLENYIVVNDVPVADFDALVQGLDVSFTNTSINGSSYQWSFGDGNTSTEENPTHTYAVEGIYNVVLIVTNECGESQYERAVNLTPEASADFSSDFTEGCTPFVVNFENLSSDNATSFFWTFEGGQPATSTDKNPSVTYADGGTFDVSLVASNANGSDTIVKIDYITIYESPVADFEFTINGADVEFVNTSTFATDIVWTIESIGTFNNEDQLSVSFAQDGFYQVTLQASNDQCGTDEKIVVIEISGYPNPAVNSNTDEICVPDVIVFKDITEEDVTERLWTFEGGVPGSSTEEEVVVSYDTPGTYNVSLYVKNNVGDATLALEEYVTVHDYPTGDFTFEFEGEGVVNFMSDVTSGATVKWLFGDGAESTALNPSHTYTQVGTYTVLLYVTLNDCEIVVSKEVKIDMVGLAQFSNSEHVVLVPNPNNGQMKIMLDNVATGDYKVEVLNSLGQALFKKNVLVSTMPTEIPLNVQGASGMYIVILSNDSKLKFFKVIIQ